MADVPVEAAPAETTTPDVWRSFRSEMDRLFDRFGFPSLRRMFDRAHGPTLGSRRHKMQVRRQHKAPTASTSLTESPVSGVYRLAPWSSAVPTRWRSSTGRGNSATRRGIVRSARRWREMLL